MDDEPDIRLVDSHPERDRGHDHVHIFHEKTVLVLGPCLRVETGVVGEGFYSVNIQ